jgi:hypothetical protein
VLSCSRIVATVAFDYLYFISLKIGALVPLASIPMAAVLLVG